MVSDSCLRGPYALVSHPISLWVRRLGRPAGQTCPLTRAARFSMTLPDALQSLAALHECAATVPPTQSPQVVSYLLACDHNHSFTPRWTTTRHWSTNWSASSRKTRSWKREWTNTWPFPGKTTRVFFLLSSLNICCSLALSEAERGTNFPLKVAVQCFYQGGLDLLPDLELTQHSEAFRDGAITDVNREQPFELR